MYSSMGIQKVVLFKHKLGFWVHNAVSTMLIVYKGSCRETVVSVDCYFSFMKTVNSKQQLVNITVNSKQQLLNITINIKQQLVNKTVNSKH